MFNLVGRSAVLLGLLVSLGVRSAGAAPSCPAPSDPRQAQLDQAGVASAEAGGLALRVVSQCAGFSVVVQDGIDDEVAEAYATQAEQAYARLASETGNTLSPRAVLFVFVDQASMATGERVVAGVTNTTREPVAGYAYRNTIWIDDSKHRVGSARAQAVAHEFSHLFASITSRGKRIPSWFDEGLAVDSEITLSVDAFPVAAKARANEERATVLDAASGEGPIGLFALDDLQTNSKWQQHYADRDKQDLEYAQSHLTVRAAMGTRGRAAAWNVLGQMGVRGVSFEDAFQTEFGRSVEQVDTAVRAAWQAEIATPPESLKFNVLIAPSADVSDVQIDIYAEVGKLASHASGPVLSGAALAFEVRADGTLVTPSGGLSTETHPLDIEEALGGSFVSVHIRRPDGSMETVSLTRSHGRWDSYGGRLLVDPNADMDLRFMYLDGPVAGPVSVGGYHRAHLGRLTGAQGF